MRLKILSKQVLWLVGSLLLFFLAILVFNFFPRILTQENLISFINDTSAPSNQEQVLNDLSPRLKIASIKVDALIEYVGLTPDGAMDIPKGPFDVALFNLGPFPGETGSAVIAGHFGWKNSLPAVFDNLHKLNIGDEVVVEDEKGEVTIFLVREMRIYGKDEAVPNVFGSSDGKAHLNLITCSGIWNESAKSRSDRLVVYTDKK